MRIFYALLIIVGAAILWMLPVSSAIYNFRTDLREDTFSSATGIDVTTANVTLFKPVYDNDTETIDILSDLATDVPAYSSYNTTSRQLGISGLSANTTRIITITYDIDALVGFDAINELADITPFIWILIIIAFPMAALLAMFLGRV